MVAAGAVGTLLAAGGHARRWCGASARARWIAGLLLLGAVAQPLLGLAFATPTVVAGGLLLGLVGQGVKICVDATLQETVDDDFRGRVFSVYDTLFNVTFVVAVLVAAVVLPPSGDSVPVLLLVGAGYLVAVVAYLGIRRRVVPAPA